MFCQSKWETILNNDHMNLYLNSYHHDFTQNQAVLCCEGEGSAFIVDDVKGYQIRFET